MGTCNHVTVISCDRIYGIGECVFKYVSSFGTLKFSTQTAELFILPVYPEH